MDLSKPFEYTSIRDIGNARARGETVPLILSPDQRQKVDQCERQARVQQWSPTLSPDNTFSSGSAWQTFRDAGKVELLCKSALDPATMVEAVADIARAILAMGLGSKYDDPKNTQTRATLLKHAPGICKTLWRHRKVVYYYEDELMDQKSSPARIHVRKYIAFILKICCMEKPEDFLALTRAHPLDLWCWCWLMCAREHERDEPSAQLDSRIWGLINPNVVWSRVVPQFLADLNLAALIMRLNLLLICSNFEEQVPHFCTILRAALGAKIVFPSLLYQDYVEKMVPYIRNAPPERIQDRFLFAGTVCDIISLAINQASDPAQFLLDLYTNTSLTFLLSISIIPAAQAQIADVRENHLRLLTITQQYCMQSNGRKLRSVIANAPGFSRDWEDLRVALDAGTFAKGAGFVSVITPVKQAVRLLSLTLGFVDGGKDPSFKALGYALDTPAPPKEALVGCTYLQCPFHQDGARVTKKCSRCGTVQYCNKTCQVNDWKAHKRACNGK